MNVIKAKKLNEKYLQKRVSNDVKRIQKEIVETCNGCFVKTYTNSENVIGSRVQRTLDLLGYYCIVRENEPFIDLIVFLNKPKGE